VWTLCLALGLLASAFPAWSAEIVEVRVGRHPEFTRVVFELDRATGYRIERSDPSMEVAELVVSLEAASVPRNIKSVQSLIELVEVSPVGSRSVARVRLAKEGLRLKEMILTNPPRIVLDVMSDAKPKPVVAKTAPAEAPKSDPPSVSEEQAFDDVVAQIPVEEPRPVEVSEPAPEPKRIEPEPVADSVAIQEALALEEEAMEEAIEIEEELEEQALAAASPSTDPSPPSDMNDLMKMVETAAEAAPEREPARPVPAATKPAPRPMVARTTASKKDEGGGWMTWALVGGGVVSLILGGVFMARRRGASDDDEHDWDTDAVDDAPVPYSEENVVDAAVDENPFSGFSEDGAETMMMNDGDATMVSLPDDEEKESESVVFDDAEETVMDDMEVISRDQVNESLGDAMPPVVGGAVPEEFQQMMAEMSRRMEALESRCDELVDARDRLERQVAAQTEELRVQRAAIARTQRAVRNLGRPEDEEQEATEPALRDPNRPGTE